MLRALIKSQQWLSDTFDRLLPKKYRLKGFREFGNDFVPSFLRPGLTIYDIGGGKNPFFTPTEKAEMEATIVGVDIDQEELDHAPPGAYDRAVCADITSFRGDGSGDLIVCRALLEHVKDTAEAFDSLASILKPGGVALIFVPSRNAIFARLNLLMPQELKRKVLHGVFPGTESLQGFPSYYDRCTPKDFRAMAVQSGLEVAEERLYFQSPYFSFFFPLYLVWRVWILAFHATRGDQAAEVFSMALRKKAA